MSDRLLQIESNSEATFSSSAPIRHLPLKVMLIIIDFARQDSPFNIPFTLSHVCREWRSLLLTSPSLWTAILVQEAPHPRPESYNLWFRRSQDLDISIHIVVSNESGMTGKEREDSIRPILLSNRRCKEIEVTGTIGGYDFYFETLIQWLHREEFPKLKKLRLAPSRISYQRSRADTKELAYMPNIESLELHTSFFTLSPAWFGTCKHLRELNLAFGRQGFLLQFLSSLSNILQQISVRLEVLRICVPDRCYYLNDPGFTDLSVVVTLLPRLRKLEVLGGDKYYFFHHFKNWLLAPRLLTLDDVPLHALVWKWGIINFAGLEILRIIGQKQANGKIFEDEKNTSTFLNVFARLSNLRSVEFTFTPWHNGEFATAFLDYCPQLVYLQLESCSRVRESDLRRLVDGRRVSKDVTTLQYLGVWNCDGLQPDDEAQAWFEARRA